MCSKRRITKTGDVDMPETTVLVKGAETETKDPTATLKTRKLDENKTRKDARHDDFEEGKEMYMYTKAKATTMNIEKLDEDKTRKDAKRDDF